MKKLNAVFLLLGVIIGFFIASILLKNNAVLNILKAVDWVSLSYWFSIFIGAAIPITLSYFLLQRQEVIKLKARLAQDKLEVIRNYKSFDYFMRSTVILDKTLKDLNFRYELTPEDESAPTLRGLIILQTHNNYDEWYLKIFAYIEQLNGLNSNSIYDYTFYILHYLLNLQLLIEGIPDESLWEVSIAVKNDFLNMSHELNYILNKYLDRDVYRFKNDLRTIKDSWEKEDIIKKLNNTDLMKYRAELANLKR